MEHIDRDDEIDSFDSYLGGKVEKVLESKKEEPCQTDVAAVESGSTEQSNSDVNDVSADSSVVPDVKEGEKTTALELRTHPARGTYLVEIPVTQPIDDEWKQVFIESYNLVAALTPEEMLDRIHRNEMAVIKLKTQNQGIRKRLEGALKDMDETRRADFLEKDKKFRAKKTSESPASKGPGSSRKSQAGKTPGMKAADTLQSLMMTKEAVVNKLKERKLYGVLEENYVEKIFASR